jgi:hypothetical protein
VARKTAPPKRQEFSSKLSKDQQKHIDSLIDFGKQFDKDSHEARMWDRYIQAVVRHEEEKARWDRMPDKTTEAFVLQERAVANAERAMFSTFDAFQHSERHTINVDEDEIAQLILDALSANVDALPDEYAQLTGLERHREFKKVAGDLIEDWKTQKVKISDDEIQEPPYCDDCEKEIAA